MAFISKELIDEIKSQNDIVDVIGSYIELNEKNKALCPFHNDHHASLSISRDKQIFKCFSCGVSGNVITFVEKYEQCEYYEAVEKLAERVGIKVNISSKKKENPFIKKYHEINGVVNNYFKNNLLSQDGKDAMKYLLDRGLTKELINDFNIGLSLSGNKLTQILTKKYNEDDLVDADILKRNYKGIYDAFQDRIIFGILDENNNVVAFSGRKYLPKDMNNPEVSKYYNTKETKVFIKNELLYNLNNSKSNIINKKEMIICEGFMDVIRLHSIGYTNVVGLMGTAFTKKHLEKIIQYKCKVVLNLDQDNAGRTSTLSIGEELIKNNIDVSVIVFDDYKDSDEFILNKGKEAFDIAYNNRVSFIDFKLKQLRNKRNMLDTSEISKYINDAINSINQLNDDILKELKIKELSSEFGIDESIIRGKINNTVTKTREEKHEIKEKKYNKYDISEIRIIYLMLNYDDVITMFENHIGGLINDDMSYLAYKIMEFRNDYGYFSYSDFIDYINEDAKLISALEKVNKYRNEETYTNEELDDYIKTIREYRINQRKEMLKKEMLETLDINKKIEIAKKIENINKEVLEW